MHIHRDTPTTHGLNIPLKCAVHTYMHACTYAHTYIHTYMYICTYITCIHKCIHICTPILVHIHKKHKCMHTESSTAYTYHTHHTPHTTHAHTHAHTHTHTHTHLHGHTHAPGHIDAEDEVRVTHSSSRDSGGVWRRRGDEVGGLFLGGHLLGFKLHRVARTTELAPPHL